MQNFIFCIFANFLIIARILTSASMQNRHSFQMSCLILFAYLTPNCWLPQHLRSISALQSCERQFCFHYLLSRGATPLTNKPWPSPGIKHVNYGSFEKSHPHSSCCNRPDFFFFLPYFYWMKILKILSRPKHIFFFGIHTLEGFVYSPRLSLFAYPQVLKYFHYSTWAHTL